MRPSEYPRWIVLQLVEACNLRCQMCYEWGERGSYHRLGSARLDFEIVRRVVRDCAPGRPCFELFGGEPFLYPRIADVIGLIGDTGCVLGIPTNGTLLDRFTDELVGEAPIRLWLSVDGPEEINDRQRGPGAFKLAVGGLETLRAARAARGCTYPQLGITYIVTPLNASHVARFFLESIELSTLDFVSIVLQNFATEAECAAYEEIVRHEFGGSSAAYARGYAEEVGHFSGIDTHHLAEQIQRVRNACLEAGVLFFSNPMTTDAINLERYFCGRWDALADRRSRCAFPWMYAEISARGDVTTCHSFYDITVGNVHDEGILDIWNGDRIQKVRSHLRLGLFPICTACCRYYNNPTSAVIAGLDSPPAAASFTAGHGPALPSGRNGGGRDG